MTLTDRSTHGPARAGWSRSALLVAGDALAFLVFAAAGRASHGEAAGLDAALQVAETAAPFVAGWLLVAPLAGAYRADVVTSPRAMAARTALAWLIACPAGLMLRALLRQSGIPLSFAITTFVVNLVILLAWRLLYASLARRRP